MLSAEIELMPGEKMVLASNPHWFYFWKQVAAGLGVIGLLLLLTTVGDGALGDVLFWVTVAAVVVLVLNTLYEFVQWKTTRFAVTSQRVAFQSGILRRRGVSIPLNRINNVNFEQSFVARLLSNGIVTIESAGETGDSVFENIPDPERVRSVIFGQVEADESADSERDAAAIAKALNNQMAPPAVADAKTPQERLQALDQLKAQGLVDDAEYAAKRRQILDDL